MTEHLNDQQTARVEALQSAAPLAGRKTGGPFGPSEPRDINDLVDLAEYIITGVHPMTAYTERQK